MKSEKRKNISHYFFGDERNSDRVSQAPPHQIGLVISRAVTKLTRPWKIRALAETSESASSSSIELETWSTRSNQRISPVPLWTAGPCVGQKLHNLPLTPCFGLRLCVPTIIQCKASWLILWLLNTRGPWSCTAPLRVTFPCRLVLLGLFFFLSDTRTASIKSLLSFRESAFHRAMRIKFLC